MEATMKILFYSQFLLVLSLMAVDSEMVRATFNMGNIVGDVTFTSAANTPVSISLNLTGVTTTYKWRVCTFPTNYDLQDRCTDADIGPLYKDHDLAGRHGDITPVSSSNRMVTDNNVKIAGPNSIAGRTLLLYTTSGRRVCATIRRSVSMVTAFARFSANVGGTIWFRQERGRPSADTTVYADLFFVDGTLQNSRRDWTILSKTVDVIAAVKANALSARCIGTSHHPSGQLGTGCSSTNQNSCTIGDLTRKHGQVDIAMHKGRMKVFYTDTNLPLGGASSVITKTIVLHNSTSKEIVSCTNLVELESKSVSSVFDMQGVMGSIKFKQHSPFDPTTVDIKLDHLNNNARGYHVHELPIPYRPLESYALCSGEAVSGHLNPFDIVIGNSPAAGTGTNDLYEIGDLSGKYGKLDGMKVNLLVTDWNLPLFGRNSIIGRSMVIHDTTNGRWVCSKISYPSEVITGVATFKYPVIGQMVFRQQKSDPLSDTSIMVNLAYADGNTVTSGHNWHAHVHPIMQDFISNDKRCAACEGHYNPFSVDLVTNYTSECAIQNPLRCECGDLSGKHGQMAIGNADPKYRWHKSYYTDIELPLSGAMSLMGMSVVIHDKNSGAGRLACTNIEPVKPYVAMLTKWTADVSGNFKLMELYDHTWITASVSKLDQKAGGYHIHELPVPEGQSSPCSAASVSGHFNPFHVNKTAGPSAGSGTKDQYEVGDLSGKYGLMNGQTQFSIDIFDNNLPLRGQNSVVGRSIVIHRSDTTGSRWTCGNIEADASSMQSTEVTAIARFSGLLSGYVQFKQLQFTDGSFGDTTILIDVYYTADKTRKTPQHNWHIHIKPVGNDSQGSACSSCGGHYNPFQVNMNKTLYGDTVKGCSFVNPLRCELGDVSGKQGRYDLGGGRVLYTDVDVPLGRNFSVMGRSVVFHVENGGAARLACADIMPQKSDLVKMTFPSTAFDKTDLVQQLASALQTPSWNIVSESATKLDSCQSVNVHLLGPESSDLKPTLESYMRTEDTAKLGKFTPTEKCGRISTSKASYIKISLFLVMMSLLGVILQ